MSALSQQNNKRIAKNTLLLYFRMLFSMGIGLFTSRIVLESLGIEDYGIYNLVGGIVTIFAFLNSAMIATSQRFISYELGKGNLHKLKDVFCTTLTIHIAIAFIIVVLSEVIGVWFLNTKLNIPSDRMMAANWTLQLSIFVFAVNVISVPYNASIVAHEKMSAFAYISIFEVSLKLAIAYLLLFISYDKLIVYSILVFCVALLLRSLYCFYCKRHFEECHYTFSFNIEQFREMFAFAGWSLVGNLGFSFKDQLSNILLNLFFGTVVNAARGISVQVGSLINSFSANFMMAMNPQITKSYAVGDLYRSKELVYAGCRFSFYLLAVISLPIMINITYILNLWLVEVPQYTDIFLILTIVCNLLYAISSPLTTAMQATGRIKWFQVIICIVMLTELPIAYLLLSIGYPPYSVLYASLFVTLLGVLIRIVLISRILPIYEIRYYVTHIFSKNILIVFITYCIAYILHKKMEQDSFFTAVLSSLAFELILFSLAYLCGLSSTERYVVNQKLVTILESKRRKNKQKNI